MAYPTAKWSSLGLLVVLTSQGLLAQRVDLGAVPQPLLDTFEPAVKLQLEVARRDAEGSGMPAETSRLCQLYLHYELYPAAEACLAQLRLLEPTDFHWPYHLGVMYSRLGQLERAEAFLNDARELQPGYAPTSIRLADLLLRRGDIDSAERIYRGALEHEPSSAAARFGLARVAMERHEYAQAIRGFEEVLERQPEGSVVHYHLGLAYRATGDLDRARQELERNRQVELVHPDPLIDGLATLDVSREATFNRALEASRLGHRKEAISALRELLAEHPEDAEAHYNLARALSDEGQLSEAERHLRAALDLRPSFRDAHFNLAVLLGRQGLTAQALEQLEAVLRADPAYLPARMLLARTYADRGDTARAVAEFRAVLEIDPSLAEAHYFLAMVHLASGAADEALGPLRKAVALEPTHLPAQRALAQLLARRGDFAAAAEPFDAWAALEPDQAAPHVGRSLSLILQGSYDAALAALEAGLERLPRQPILLDMTARFLATCPDDRLRDGARAETLARRALGLAPSIDATETLAMALAEQGRFDEAIELQSEVVAREPQPGSPSSEQRLERLALYRKRIAVRSPWQTTAQPRPNG